MGKKISDEDKALFRNALKDAKIQKSDDKRYTKKPASPVKYGDKEITEEDPIIIHYSENDLITGDDKLFYHRGGVSPRNLRKLSQGNLPCQATLDLHGHTSQEANEQLIAFIKRCQQQGLKHLRVIHGRGHRSNQTAPVIKNLVNQCLRQLPEVLVFASCSPKDGGVGAVYVLLKSLPRNR